MADPSRDRAPRTRPGVVASGGAQRLGALTLTTRGRLSGQERAVIVAYLHDGDRLHTLAMNGWGEGHPAWWQNLQADPRAEVMLPDGTSRAVLAHRAEGAEHERLWARWVEINPGMDRLAAERQTPTDVVVLSPE